jgi:molybdopterin/thiamine biosynthesis adenylyltransferase
VTDLRLDRQLRIPQWRQEVLNRACLGVVGDDPQLTSLFLLSAAALGINDIRVVAPELDPYLISLARSLNPHWRLHHLRGYLSHPFCLDALRQCHPLVDLSHFALASKILLEEAYQHRRTVVRCRRWTEAARHGLALFTYQRGREWSVLAEVLPSQQLPAAAMGGDGVLDIIAAGLILEEVKTILMTGEGSPALISYQGRRWPAPDSQPAIGVVGAGALGNFVGLGLALAGFRRATFWDPDIIDVTNLNRQIFFGGAVGAPKAATLAARLNQAYAVQMQAHNEVFQAAAAARYDIICDCVDNFASRILISQACAAAGTPLISGGTHISQGQVVAYHPRLQPQTPAELLNMPGEPAAPATPLAARSPAACTYQPNPAVIMTNQIIAGFMVEALRHLLAHQPWPPLFYDAAAPHKIGRDR